MANGDYGYFGKGSTGYAQYMTAFNRNFGGSSGGGGNHNNGGGGADRAVRFENDAQGVAVNYHVVSETVCRMWQAACPASVGAEWKEEIEADFQKRHQG